MIARVAVDTPLAHLDRLFDYEVPQGGVDVVPGCRIKVRFAGRLVDGFVVELAETSEVDRIAPIAKVVSAEPVLTREIFALARAIADRYAGTVSDVLRLAIPKRHARAEAAMRPDPGALPSSPGRWEPQREVWSVVPGENPAGEVAQRALAALHAGRGTIVVVPDVRDVQRWDVEFTQILGAGHHVVLTAAQSAEARYKAFLAASRGNVRIVLGTRAAALAPVRDLGQVVIWDDGNDLYAEPRAPYCHAREVLLLRAAAADAGVLVAGYARTAEAQSLVSSGWCVSRAADPEARRAAWPRLDVVDGSEEGQTPVRLPGRVVKAIREADGPVLVQVPRRGYRAALACQGCRERARCAQCHGPLAQRSAQAPPGCVWCAAVARQWACPHCGSRTLRAPVIGHLRTAEEFARTFPGRAVLTSGGDAVRDRIDDPAAIVLATPGAEPTAPGGYALVVLLDTWLMLARDDIRVTEESHRRWFNALALARPGGKAVAVGDPQILQALVRADPIGFAERELDDRSETHLPPVARLATVEGPAAAIVQLAGQHWSSHAEVLGPVPLDEVLSRLIVRVPRAEGNALSAVVREFQSARAAAKQPPLRTRIDPMVL